MAEKKLAAQLSDTRSDLPNIVTGFPRIDGTTFPYEWIQYDSDNLYPQRLWNLIKSQVHARMLKTKATAVIGGGLEWDYNNQSLNQFFRNATNSDPDTHNIDAFVYKLAYDFVMYGAFTYKVGYSVAERRIDPVTGEIIVDESKRKIVRLNYVDTQQVRAGRPNEYGEIKCVYVSRDWKARYMNLNKIKRYELFDEDAPLSDWEVVYERSMATGSNWYPLPEYLGAINDILCDIQFAEYRKNMLMNQFTPSVIVSFPQDPPLDVQAQMVADLKKEFSGVQNAGNVLGIFGQVDMTGKGQTPNITLLKLEDNVGLYDAIEKSTKVNIITAHGLNPALAGYNTEGKLTSDGKTIEVSATLFEEFDAPMLRAPILASLQNVLRYNQQYDPFLTDDAIESVRFKKRDLTKALNPVIV